MKKSWFLTSIVSMSTRGITNWSKLSKAWSKDFINNESYKLSNTQQINIITSALTRTLPLLEDPTSIPFVCRYRADIIKPLTTSNVHKLSEYIEKYKSLSNLRDKILEKLPDNVDENLKLRIETSISKSELDDLYIPYKPITKGSLEDRIKNDYPDLDKKINEFWLNSPNCSLPNLKHRDAVITLLSNRIASNPNTIDSCHDYVQKWCKIKVEKAITSSKTATTTTNTISDEEYNKYIPYFNFECQLNKLRDYQVLAIRRGIDKKTLKISYDIDNERVENLISRSLGYKTSKYYHIIWKDSINDTWNRLLRKRCTSRAWKLLCNIADEHAIEVFSQNLYKALLTPPLQLSTDIIGVDPGFKAGIKIALINSNGQLIDHDSLLTINFLGSSRNKAIEKFIELFQFIQKRQQSIYNKVKESNTDTTTTTPLPIVIALGNGHGSQEARQLLIDASKLSNIDININLINEAGASVWSVTEQALKEYPNETSASIASISIARRYQNPLPELVKIPPRSLGLGMYQHDFTEKILDIKLNSTSINAVSEVGVDINSCSIEILEKIPSITKVLAERIIKSRPINSRNDLLNIQGMGPKTYENCIAFIRINNGNEELDNTMCHPESYNLARYILHELKWNLKDPLSINQKYINELNNNEYKDIIQKAIKLYDVTEERVLSVIQHLIQSITNPDPRIKINANTNDDNSNIGTIKNCINLPSTLININELRNACPVRNIKGYVRNIIDFGAFIDFGGENDGLLHKTKMGKTSITLNTLLVGQEIGIDILEVSKTTNKISVSLSNLNLISDNNNNEEIPISYSNYNNDINTDIDKKVKRKVSKKETNTTIATKKPRIK